MKKIFIIDWWLLALFTVTLVSGIALHIAGHEGTTLVWHIWAALHSAVSLSFITAVALHLSTHNGWMRTVFDRRPDRRRTLVLLLGAFSAATMATGIALLFIYGANTSVGLWHYRLGILTGIMALGHTAKRFPVLRKSIGR